MEAEENLERLHDEVPLSEPARKGPENATVITPEIQSPFPAQRQNIFPIGGLEGIPATSTTQELSDGPSLSGMQEQVSALHKPYPGAPIVMVHGVPVWKGFNFGQPQASRHADFITGTTNAQPAVTTPYAIGRNIEK